jgi:hypothetical protein
MENSLYQFRVYISRLSGFLSEHFSAQKDLYWARWESLHKLARFSISRKFVAQNVGVSYLSQSIQSGALRHAD